MSMNDDQDVIHSMTRTIQIIAGSLITGVVVFLVVSVVVAPIVGAPPVAVGAVGAGQAPDANAGPPPAAGSMDLGEIITWTAVAVAAAGLPLSFWLPGWMTSQNRRSIAAGTWAPPSRADAQTPGPPAPFGPEALQSDAGKLALLYQTQFLVGAAINEGLAFFASVAYLIGKNPIALGLALVLLVALIVRFPTRPRIASWLDRQQELLIQDRQAAF
jgi:hypothetical protein